jgi:hypothetical protein
MIGFANHFQVDASIRILNEFLAKQVIVAVELLRGVTIGQFLMLRQVALFGVKLQQVLTSNDGGLTGTVWGLGPLGHHLVIP